MARIKQFFNCITAKVNQDDIDFINKYLNEDEKKLLFRLQECDIKHSVNVGRDIKNNIPLLNSNLDDDKLVKAGLLHDIGKAYRPLNPIDKSILVVLNYFSKGKLKNIENKNKKVYIYYNHGEKGYEDLKKYNYDSEFLNAVRYHHKQDTDNELINILHKFDNRN